VPSPVVLESDRAADSGSETNVELLLLDPSASLSSVSRVLILNWFRDEKQRRLHK
jgi:hypothetical protein